MMQLSRYLGVLALLVAVFPVDAAQVLLTNIGYSEQQPEKLVFDLSGAVKHRCFTLDNPNRLVVDFENTRLQQAIAAPSVNHPFFVNIRSSARNNNDLRVVFELKNPVEAKALSNPKALGRQLQFDILAKEGVRNVGKVLGSVAKDRNMAANTNPESGMPVSVLPVVSNPKPVSLKGRDIVVAIDAGHGGKDVGAQGNNGTQEKDVVFAIAKRLEGYVNAQPGMKALMIRKGDYFVKLHERVNIAKAAKADLFVSIHADAFNDSSAHGASVYTLSKKGASSDGARWLAESENASDRLGSGADSRDETLASVLMDLSQTAAKEASQNVGSKVLRNIQTVGHLHRESVQKAGFVVLKSADIPSILVETAFISNPDEEQRLNTIAYQDKMASAVFRGIMAHFKQYAPANTLIAQMSKSGSFRQVAKLANPEASTNKSLAVASNHNPLILSSSKSQHVINEGETLSEIAHQYGVSMRALRVVNGMGDGNLRVGQVLQIPSNT